MDMLLRRRALMMNQGFEVEWNQLVQNGDFSQGATGWDIGLDDWNTKTFENNEMKVDVNSPSTSIRAMKASQLISSVPLTDKIYSSFKGKSDFNEQVVIAIAPNRYIYYTNINGFPTEVEYKRGARISQDTRNWLKWITLAVYANANVGTFCVTDIHLINLTQMFGSGNEPTTVQQFEAWLIENNINPNEYIPYNAGEKRKMTKPSWL